MGDLDVTAGLSERETEKHTKESEEKMPEEIKMVHSYIPTPPEITVKLERGQKGTYAFEIKVEGTVALEILEKIKNMDAILRREFCPEKEKGE